MGSFAENGGKSILNSRAGGSDRHHRRMGRVLILERGLHAAALCKVLKRAKARAPPAN